MSISQKKIAANRRNAQKSTGPKTESGKAASCANALKHGLYSDNIIIRSPDLSENPAEYELLITSLREELNPETVLQECLVRKIANCIWRSRRVIEAESAHILDRLDKIDEKISFAQSIADSHARFGINGHPRLTDSEITDRRAKIASRCLIPDRKYTHDLVRYEMRLDRQLTRIYALYWHLKSNKQGKARLSIAPPEEPIISTPRTELIISAPPVEPAISASPAEPAISASPAEPAISTSPVHDLQNVIETQSISTANTVLQKKNDQNEPT